MPEPFILSDEENDNLFFGFGIEAEGYEADAELALVVDVKNTDEEGHEYLYSVFLDIEDLEALAEWAKKAIRYIKYVNKAGAPIPLILGVLDEDGNLDSEQRH